MSNDLKATPTLGVVFALCVATVVWVTGGKEVHAAVVSGVFTIFAAAGAAYIAFWQLRKQRDNAAEMSLLSEKLKLKKQIYEEIADACRDGFDAVGAMESYVLNSYTEARKARELFDDDIVPSEPKHRYTKVQKLETKVLEAVHHIIRILSRWEVIDPRTRVFKFAMNVALFEIREAMTQYH